MSAPESREAARVGAGAGLCTGEADIVELAGHRGCAAGLRILAAGRGVQLPDMGRAIAMEGRLALCVRPERWLLLQPPRTGGDGASEWQAACTGIGTAVDLSSGLALLRLRGPRAVDLLDRHCRLDLRREHFGTGSAAATLIAQVPIIIVARPRGLLLATPASTARHLREWLVEAGQPFGLGEPRSVPAAELLGE